MSVSIGHLKEIVGKQKGVDTVVFVHGIWFGHHRKTWRDFVRLMPTDPDLPRLDLLLWGYKTGLVKGKSVCVDGEQLATDLRVQVSPPNAIVLVGHSLGGLLILRSICDQMKRGLALAPSISLTNFIVLFGTPLSGRGIGTFARLLAPVTSIFNRQFKDLCKTSSCAALLEDVKECIYFDGENTEKRRKIPIRLHVGSQDWIVSQRDRSAAKAHFNDLPPYEHVGTHSSIKEPLDRKDTRYKALANDIQEAVATTFVQLSSDYLNAANTRERDAAWQAVCFRYEKISRARVKAYPSLRGKEEVVFSALHFAAEHSQESSLPAHILIDHAVRSIIGRSKRCQTI